MEDLTNELIEAIRNNNLFKVNNFINKEVNINAKDKWKTSPLMYAA